jgi:hypothetical protein
MGTRPVNAGDLHRSVAEADWRQLAYLGIEGTKMGKARSLMPVLDIQLGAHRLCPPGDLVMAEETKS